MSWRPFRKPATPSPETSPGSQYWNLDLSRGELGLMAGVLGISVVLHLTPVLQSGYAVHLVCLVAAMSFLSPTTGFFFIGASAILPTADPDTYIAAREAFESGGRLESLESAAKFGFLVWAIVTPLRYRRLALQGIGQLWLLLPWAVWASLTSGLSLMGSRELLKSVAFCVMGCQLSNEANGKYLKCLLGFCLGCLTINIGYWANALGLPVELSEWGGSREGFERLGSVAADSVMLWPPMLVGVGGLLGMALAMASKANRRKVPKWLVWLCLILLFGSLPPLVASMTHSGYLGFGIIIAAVAGSYVLLQASDLLTREGRRVMGAFFSIILVASVAGFAFDVMHLRTKAVALLSFYDAARESSGAAASRSEVWQASLETICKYPLMGVDFNNGTETIPAQYVAFGWFMSHNVFLDAARHAGIPGMLLLACFFFGPVVVAFSRRVTVPALPFLIAHFGFFIFYMSLSFPFYKAFWGFWMLMALAVARIPSRIVKSSSVPRTRRATAKAAESASNSR